jgi:hypothetical protein
VRIAMPRLTTIVAQNARHAVCERQIVKRIIAGFTALAASVVSFSARAEQPQPDAAPFLVVMALRYGSVLGPSAATGAIIRLEDDEQDSSSTQLGMLIRSEVGFGGTKLDLGAARFEPPPGPASSSRTTSRHRGSRSARRGCMLGGRPAGALSRARITSEPLRSLVC